VPDTTADPGDSHEPERSPVDDLIDLLVYAPLGLALSASEELPKWVEKGRQQLAGQVPAARAVGSVAMTEGQKRLERLARLAVEWLVQAGRMSGQDRAGRGEAGPEEAPAGPSATVSTPAADAANTASDAAPGSDAATSALVDTPLERQVAPQPVRGDATAAAPSAAELAIPGYDALSASQVVQRLGGLAPEELEAVRAYESATRRRKTILTRIAQLQAP
jgi:hypothetical protein